MIRKRNKLGEKKRKYKNINGMCMKNTWSRMFNIDWHTNDKEKICHLIEFC